MCALNGALRLCLVAVTLSDEPARGAQLIVRHEGKFRGPFNLRLNVGFVRQSPSKLAFALAGTTFRKVAIVTPLDAVRVVVRERLALLSGIKSEDTSFVFRKGLFAACSGRTWSSPAVRYCR